MFEPVPMLQMRAVVLERHQRAVLKDWGRRGAVQLVPQPADLELPSLLAADNSGQRAQCERLLSGMETLRQALGIAAEPRSKGEAEELTLLETERQLTALQDRAGELLRQREGLARRRDELSALEEQVVPYCGLDLPLDEPERFEFLHFVTGRLPADKLEQLQLGGEVALLPLAIQNGRQALVAVTTPQWRRALDEALAQADFEPERLPAVSSATADTLSEENRREAALVKTGLEQAEEQVRRLAAEVARPLAKLERTVKLERCLLEAERRVPRTEVAVLLSGWVPAEEAPALEQRLREITGNRCVVESAAPEALPEEQVPVLLHHARLLRPFELLVKGYGLPQYGELEPTLFVALSFLLMFGMMFGDVGHGAVLAAMGLLGWWRGRQGKFRDAGLLFLFGGVSSMVFGLLYGSYFGLPGLKRYALWHDPLEGDPMSLMRAAVGLGVAMLSLGVLLNVVNRFRHGDFLGGIMDKFGLLGVLFYWGMLALTTNYAAVRASGLVRPAVLLFLGLPVLGWVLKGPLEYGRGQKAQPPQAGGLWAAIAESSVGAFEGILSYLANTISFVRLAAYALSHAALLMATFLLAAQVQRASATGGVLVIVLGNGVALVLEGVIASVQALRLEYYEFFSKFFSGAGRAFEPFQLTV